MGNTLAANFSANGHEVHLVCPPPSIAKWMGSTLESPRVLNQMIELGVRMYPNTSATRWNGSGLDVVRSDTGEGLSQITRATLIDVSSRLPDENLLRTVQKDPALQAPVSAARDCVAPGIIQAAVFSGHTEARRLIEDVPKSGIWKKNRQSCLMVEIYGSAEVPTFVT